MIGGPWVPGLIQASKQSGKIMIGRLFGRSLKGAAKRGGNSRVRLRQFDADDLAIPVDLAYPILVDLAMHAVQTTESAAGFNRFGERAILPTK